MPLPGTNINPNRAVAVLTPLVFAPLAGGIAAGVAKYGVDVDDGQLQAIFIAGATVALAKAAQWTKGWQAFEQRQDVTAAATAQDDHLLDDDDDLGDDAADALDEGDVFAEAEPDDDEFDDADLGGDDMDDFDTEAAELLSAEGS